MLVYTLIVLSGNYKCTTPGVTQGVHSPIFMLHELNCCQEISTQKNRCFLFGGKKIECLKLHPINRFYSLVCKNTNKTLILASTRFGGIEPNQLAQSQLGEEAGCLPPTINIYFHYLSLIILIKLFIFVMIIMFLQLI